MLSCSEADDSPAKTTEHARSDVQVGFVWVTMKLLTNRDLPAANSVCMHAPCPTPCTVRSADRGCNAGPAAELTSGICSASEASILLLPSSFTTQAWLGAIK